MAGKDTTEFEELDLDNLEAPQDDLPVEEPKKVLQSGAESEEPEFVYEDEDQEEKEAEAKEKDEEQKKGKARKSRAQTRIRKLAQERNELQERLEREQRARYAAEERLRESTVRQTQSSSKMLEARIRDIKEDQAQALQMGDYKRHAELTQELTDANLQKRVMDYESSNVPRHRRPPPRPLPRRGPEIPEATQDWAENNPWFVQPKSQDDAIKRQAALVISNEMIAKGMNPDDDDFYSELDKRLASKFSSSPSENQESPKQDQRPVVGGTGRQGVSRRSNTRTRRLTPQDREIIESLGITPQEYIRQLDAQEQSGGGWTEIE